MNIRPAAVVVAAALTFTAIGVRAAEPLVGDAKAGATKAAACGACHGITGVSEVNPEWPNLAGQGHWYIAEQLAYFKGGVRANAVMGAQAIALEPQDMADIAAYFELQTPKGLEADPSLVDLGRRLYRAGDAKRGLPACFTCHGPDGRGNGPAKWPAVRAQHDVYVYNQLKNYAARTKYTKVDGQPSPPERADMMYTVAGKLTDEEMKAVSSYIQGLR